MGTQKILEPSDLASGRLRIDIMKEIQKLNIDKTPLMKLLTQVGKDKATQLKYQWLTKERRPDWVAISAAAGGAWASAAAATGTLTVATASAWLFAAGDIIKVPEVSDVNIYVISVVQSTGVLTCKTYNGTSTIDFSSSPSGKKILNISNSFELGSNRGTVKNFQPSESYNYIQIIQDPWGVEESLRHVGFDAGGSEWDEMAQETAIEHEFKKEKTFFFGQKHLATTGYMNAEYSQYFTGGLLEGISTNVDTQTELTQKEFGAWLNGAIYYAEKPVIFAGARIFEALSWWLGEAGLQTRQDEKTLGIAVSNYMNEYGQVVKVIPHRELLKEAYAGYAFCVDLKDVKYKFLQGEDTHIEVGIQTPGDKKEINEYRTWFGVWMGNEKRHGCLKGVNTIA